MEHGIKVIYYSTVPDVNEKYSCPYKVYETVNEVLAVIQKVNLTN